MANIIKNLHSVPTRFYLFYLQVTQRNALEQLDATGCPTGTTGGTITSPGYPNDYASKGSFTCVYRLTASAGHTTKMTLAMGANVQVISGITGLIVSKYATRNNILARKDKLIC